jgi:hypothetical protein
MAQDKSFLEAALVEVPKQTTGVTGSWNFSFAVTGALILNAAQQPSWRDLLGVAKIGEHCAIAFGDEKTASFNICAPSIDRLDALEPALQALGYKSSK